jgi:hypothetical protein
MAEHTIQLVNTFGAIVWQQKTPTMEGQNVISINDLQTLPAGMYVLRILVGDGQIYNYKMQKQ